MGKPEGGKLVGAAINYAMQSDTTLTASKLNTLEPLLEAWGEHLDPDLLVLIITHRSLSHEHGKTGSCGASERLEFLGNAVLRIIVTEYPYRNFSDEPGGTLVQMRVATVSQAPLTEVIRKIHLEGYLRLEVGEDRQGGRDKDPIFSDTLEALIGTTFLSCGLSVTRVVVERHSRCFLRDAPRRAVTLDWRITLQELLSATDLDGVTYEMVVTGPGHQKHFSAQAPVEGENWGEGQGSSKKIAGHQAAEAAVATLTQYCPRVVGPGAHQDLFPDGDPGA